MPTPNNIPSTAVLSPAQRGHFRVPLRRWRRPQRVRITAICAPRVSVGLHPGYKVTRRKPRQQNHSYTFASLPDRELCHDLTNLYGRAPSRHRLRAGGSHWHPPRTLCQSSPRRIPRSDRPAAPHPLSAAQDGAYSAIPGLRRCSSPFIFQLEA